MRVTTNCLARWRGVTAVHFVINNFLNLGGFFGACAHGASSFSVGK